ncbi:MAG TPA: hypothetical protein VLV48_06735, partial [Thermoanaerobaculia bacterium]|nr:hypothetical protein [Thermoanaerobaculia bacterium]
MFQDGICGGCDATEQAVEINVAARRAGSLTMNYGNPDRPCVVFGGDSPPPVVLETSSERPFRAQILFFLVFRGLAALAPGWYGVTQSSAL